MPTDKTLLEEALHGARLLYAYTIFIEAPIADAFRLTGDPAGWTRDFNGNPLPLSLGWKGAQLQPGSVMTLSATRRDGTVSPVGATSMELLYFERNAEISYRYLVGNHLIYRFVYEEAGEDRTEFTVNALLDAQSPIWNSLRQRIYAKRRRKAAIEDHLRVKREIEARYRKRG